MIIKNILKTFSFNNLRKVIYLSAVFQIINFAQQIATKKSFNKQLIIILKKLYRNRSSFS